jgi:hypothetical protein
VCGDDELGFGVSYYEEPFAFVRGQRNPINFNVNHSGNHGLIAFAYEGRVGVYVEEFDPTHKSELPVESAFTPAERFDLDSGEKRIGIYCSTKMQPCVRLPARGGIQGVFTHWSNWLKCWRWCRRKPAPCRESGNFGQGLH